MRLGVTRDEVQDSNAEEIRCLIKKNETKEQKPPRGGENKQAGRQAEDWCTVKHTLSNKDTRKTMDQHRTADTRMLYRETNEGNKGDTAGATETMIK